ncbi:MAG TPA: response regulator [Pyrinomonadaceae bacterium]|jgi:DNA-binding response OmpR family regulator|nr:response regulator [Pyrinomonadaceae bacterium]
MILPSPRVIFYLEDNERILVIVREVLEFAGWYVTPCNSGFYAWTMLGWEKQHYDLLVLDNEADRLDGLTLTRRVRRMPHRKETPIILTSREDLEAEAREAGADAFLRKPYNLIELVDTIRRLFAAPAGA